MEFVVDEVVRVYIPKKHDIPTAPTIAAVGSAPRLVFFAAEADTASSTITGSKLHRAFVDKHSVHNAEARRFAKKVSRGAGELRFKGRQRL